MGNSHCCQEQNLKLDLSQIAIQQPTYASIQNYLHQHPTINKILQQNGNLQQQYRCRKTSMIKNLKQYSFEDGIFIGTMSKSFKKTGYGIMLYKKYQYYEGQWKEGLKQGLGILATQDGSFYYGQWKNDLAEGNGIFSSIKSMTTYKGQWKAGLKNGKGKQNYEDGSIYCGDFVNGVKNAIGKLIYQDKTSYEGQFVENIIQGHGIFIGKNNRYEGSWKQGNMHGAGKSQWYNENNQLIAKYIGQYQNGIKSGFGQYTDSQGTTYKAIWTNGQINQKASIIIQNQRDQ